MPNAQPPEYRTADEVLDRARALFSRANLELARGIGVTVDDDHMSRLYRAQTFALVARAGAELATAMLAADLTPLGRPPDHVLAALREDRFPCSHPDCAYVAPNTYRLTDHLVAEHGLDTKGGPDAPPHSFVREQRSSTHCLLILDDGRDCNRSPDDPVHQAATDAG
jgi:hypothetical protein